MKKIVITGAHFTPAEAVIKELLKDPDIEIVYIGRSSTREGDNTPSQESQILPKMGVKFIAIEAGRVRRFISVRTFISLIKIPWGFLQAFTILLIERPDIVLSFGGYVSVPVVLSAWLLSIPIVIHEQTLISGLANQFSNIFADKIFVSFDKKYNFSKDKQIFTGNPLRAELFETGKSSSEIKKMINLAKLKKLPLVYITGGNQGSHIINELVFQRLEDLLSKAVIIHQTGDSKEMDYERLVDKSKTVKNKDRYLVSKWINTLDLADILPNASFTISRAGANSMQEFAFFRLPVIVIPLPYLYKDEQRVNARYFRDKGLATILEQSDATPENFLTSFQEGLKNWQKMKNDLKGQDLGIIKDASKRVALETKLMLV